MKTRRRPKAISLVDLAEADNKVFVKKIPARRVER